MINIDDYVIKQDGKDWYALLEGWLPLLPRVFGVWVVNRLGDVILVSEDRTIHFFEVGCAQIQCIAIDQEEFYAKLVQDENALYWLAIPQVDACVAAGKLLEVGQCYGFTVPPMLGGRYEVENLEPTDLAVHYALLADIWQQIKDLPEGTVIESVQLSE